MIGVYVACTKKKGLQFDRKRLCQQGIQISYTHCRGTHVAFNKAGIADIFHLILQV